MILNLSEIKEEGGSFTLRRKPRWLRGDDNPISGIAIVDSDIEFQISVSKMASEVEVGGKIEFTVSSQCSLCLSDMSVDKKVDLRLILSPRDAERNMESGGEVDYETYGGKTIDLNDYMREQINLSLPYKTVCSESCKGLCCGCGKNLNRERCECEVSDSESAFAILKGIKI